LGEGEEIEREREGEMAVPLAVLLKREHTSERIENPDVLYGQASHSKKGEDFTFFKTECQRVSGDGSTTFSVFAVCSLVVCQNY
jgi:hypothetical protein